MNHFERLGLASDADEATIKRAYARALKDNRPEDDAVAFQELNEAYQRAIAHARQRMSQQRVPDNISELAPQPGAQPESPPASEAPRVQRAAVVPDAEALDFNEFATHAAHLCREGSPRELSEWLHALPALYLIERKEAIGIALHRFLASSPEPVEMRPGHAEKLSEFFQIDFFPILNFAKQAEARRELEENIAGERMRYLGSPEAARKYLKQLKRPFRLRQALLVALVPGYISGVATLAHRLRQRNEGVPPSGIDAKQATFFESLGDPGFQGRSQWHLLLARTLACIALMIVIGGVSYSAFGQMPLGAWLIIGYVGGFLWVREGIRWIRIHEDQPFAAGRVARWLPAGFMALAELLAWLDAFKGLIFFLLGLIAAIVLRSVGGVIQCAALAFAASLVLVPAIGAHASSLFMGVSAVVAGLFARWCMAMVVTSTLKRPLAHSDGWWSASIAVGAVILAACIGHSLG